MLVLHKLCVDSYCRLLSFKVPIRVYSKVNITVTYKYTLIPYSLHLGNNRHSGIIAVRLWNSLNKTASTAHGTRAKPQGGLNCIS